MRPAEAVRRILNSIFRRHPVQPLAPDFEPPPAPELQPVVPEMHEAPGWLHQQVRELAQSGALDEGHGGLFDSLVDRLVDVWDSGHTPHRREYLEHLAHLDRTRIELTASAGWVRRQEQDAEARVAAVDLEIQRSLDEADQVERQRHEARRQRRQRRQPENVQPPRPEGG